MKLKIQFIFLLLNIVTQAQIINFTDINFKNALLNHYPIIDINNDNEIQINEANSFTYTLNLSLKNISDLSGIEYFNQVEIINCSINNLQSLDLSSNISLKTLDCSSNNLSTLDLSQNTNLMWLDCSSNEISILDLSNLPLTFLDCSYNNIFSFQLPNSINEIWCNNNSFTNLDVSNHNNLIWLFCGENYDLLSININGCTSLFQLNFSFTNISNIDLSDNVNLSALEIPENEIASLNTSNLPNLKYLYCGGNNISSINVNQNNELKVLGVGLNSITTLDVSNNPNLEMLWCHNNNLTALDVSNNALLVDFWCQNNSLIFLDVRNGNNLNFTRFNAVNENLTCIYVDNTLYSQENWLQIHSNSHFVETEEECEELAENDNIMDNKMIVYPNPVKNTLYIKKNTIGIKEINVFDILGKEVLKTNKTTIDFSTLENGLYIIKIKSENNNISTKKVIKIGA